MDLQEIGQWAVSLPIIATVVSVYHKAFILPHRVRIEKLEEVCTTQNEVLARLDERTKKQTDLQNKMWNLLDKKLNGKR